MQEVMMMGGGKKEEPQLGDLVDGVRFFGEVPGEELITTAQLSTEISITPGVLIEPNTPWLHFELDGKTLYVAKRACRESVSWDQLNSLGVVFGTRTVEINGRTYMVRILRSSTIDPTVTPNGFNRPELYLAEWGRLWYKIYNGLGGSGNDKTTEGYWPIYSYDDLFYYGKREWGQETRASNSAQRAWLGWRGISEITYTTNTRAMYDTLWRPVLELME